MPTDAEGIFCFLREFLQLLGLALLVLLSRLQHQAGFPSQRATSFAAAFAARHTYKLRGYYSRTQQGASPVAQARNALVLNMPTGMFVLLSMFSKPKRKLCGGLRRPAYVQLRGYYSIFPSFVKELIMIK